MCTHTGAQFGRGRGRGYPTHLVPQQRASGKEEKSDRRRVTGKSVERERSEIDKRLDKTAGSLGSAGCRQRAPLWRHVWGGGWASYRLWGSVFTGRAMAHKIKNKRRAGRNSQQCGARKYDLPWGQIWREREGRDREKKTDGDKDSKRIG